ncbi:MAG: hypothetical protein KAT35_01425, partial [Candidatus Aenigmarchaeota archaeon]|nr:hypothetical protein [Candidatus Aenigmarchaeota archaeon]
LVAEAAGTANLTVTGEYTYDGVVYSIEFINQVVVSAAGDDGNGDDDNGGTIGGIQYDCITDSDCDSDEECDSDFMCVEIDCDAGYYATGHTCKISPVYEIEIISYEDELSLNPGESVETNLSVNNTGNQNLTVIMSVDADIEGVDFNVTPLSQAVTVGESGHFTVRFIVSEDAAIGKHTINYKATTSSIAKDTKSFILIVQPQPDDIEEIKQSYQNLTAVVSQLLAEFNAIKGQLSGDNLTAMETKINATQTLFNSLKTSMKGEDYAQAYMYLEELNALIGSTMSLMEDLGVSGLSAGFWNAVMIWVVVAFVCVGAVGLLIYMMVPARGYALGKGYTPQGKPSIINKLKDYVLSLRGKMPGSKPTSAGQIVQKYKPAYSEGYDKLSSSFKPQPTGVASKMKKVFKKEK